MVQVGQQHRLLIQDLRNPRQRHALRLRGVGHRRIHIAELRLGRFKIGIALGNALLQHVVVLGGQPLLADRGRHDAQRLPHLRQHVLDLLRVREHRRVMGQP
ncbi:hypothetical protein D3C87_1364320 [compost metagenome]